METETYAVVRPIGHYYITCLCLPDGEIMRRRQFRYYSEARTQALDWVEQDRERVITTVQAEHRATMDSSTGD